MLFLAAAALAAQPAPAPQATPARQARAMVTIISGAKLRFAEIEKRQPQLFRLSTVRAPDGSPQAARLVEYQ